MLLMLIKALYTLVLPPACFALLFAALAVWLHTRARRRGAALLLAAGTLLFWFSGTPLVGSALLRSLEERYNPPASPEGADAIVMLTGGAVRNTPNLGGATGHVTGRTAGRLLTAARLARDTGLPLIVSGGQVFASGANEADTAKRELLGLGLPDGQLWLDRTSRNTEENAANCAELLRVHGWSRPLLVTSASHMPRAMAWFRREGIEAVPVPTDYTVDASAPPSLLSFLLSSSGMGMTAEALKEYLGLLAARFIR